MLYAHLSDFWTNLANKLATSKKALLLALLTAIALGGVVFSGSSVHSSDVREAAMRPGDEASASAQHESAQRGAQTARTGQALAQQTRQTSSGNFLPLNISNEQATAEGADERPRLSHSPALKFFPALAVGPITASMTDTLVNDDGDNKIDPTNGTPATEERITYTVTITNTGTDPATNLKFTDIIDSHTTLVTGSKNTSPIADVDSYSASGNIPIALNVAGGVLANDVDPDTGNNTGLTVTEVQGVGGNVGVATNTTATGRGGVKGSVTLFADGHFTYEPPPGFTGDDTFTYKVSDGTATDTTTVTITITGMAWFIKTGAGGSNIGTFSNPFTTIGAFNTANAASGNAPDPKNGDFIALRTGTYSEADGINLRNTQKLIGEAIQFSTVFTAAANSSSTYNTFATGTAAAPTINTSAGNGVDLADSNTVRGLNVGNTPGFFGFNGGAVGSPIINAVGVTGTGGAINISTSGAFGANVTFATLESTSSPTSNINLVSVTGTLGVTSGGAGLSGSAASSNAITINGGSVSLSYPGNVDKANTGSLVNVTGGHSGTLTFTGTLTANAGDGLQFKNADGTYNFTGTTTLNGGDAGIDIGDSGAAGSGSVGTFSFNANTTITNPTNEAIAISSIPTATSAPTFTYSGSFTKNNGGRGILIQNNTSGTTINFDGASATETKTITTTTALANAIDLLNNSSAVINFTGNNLVLAATGTGGGLNATGGGTITVQGTGNTISTGSGTALNVATTSIGAGGLTFLSISSNGGTNGIVLNNVGTGGLTVTGTGTTAGSGGLIQNKQQGAVFMTMSNLSLKNMNFTNAGNGNGGVGACQNIETTAFNDNSVLNSGCQAAINLRSVTTATLDRLVLDGGLQNGINGQTVSGLTISNSTVKNFGDAVNEDPLRLFNLTGTCSITNSTLQNGGEFLADIRNISSTALNLTVDTVIFTDTDTSATGAAGFSITGAGSSNITLLVDNSTFTKIVNAAFQVIGKSTAVMTTNFTDNSVEQQTAATGRAVDIGAQNTAQINFNVNHNTKLYSKGGTSVNIYSFNSSVIQGRVNNNTDIRCGGVGSPGTGVAFQPQDNSTGTVEIIGNTISQIGSTTDAGIRVLSFGDNISQFNATADATITSNNITLISNGLTGGSYIGGLFGVQAQAGSNASDSIETCADLQNNTISATPNPVNGSDNTALRTREGSATSQLYLEAMSAGATNAARALNTWTARGNTPAFNSASDAGGAPAYSAPPGGAPYNGVCRAPSNPTAMLNFGNDSRNTLAQTSAPPEFVSGTATLWASLAHAENNPSSGVRQIERLSDFLARQARKTIALYSERLNGSTDEPAVEGFASAGIGADPHASLVATASDALTTEAVAAEQQPPVLTPAATAINATAQTAAEAINTVALAASQPAETVASSSRQARSRDMVLSHAVRTRVRPSAMAAALVSGETVTVAGSGTGFTLPGGKTITVTFQVTLNNPPNVTYPWPTGGPQVSNQGTVKKDDLSINVLTDDPSPPAPLTNGSNDPTVTYVDLFNSQTALATDNASVNQNDSVTFTATVSLNPVGSPAGTPPTPTGTVDFFDGTATPGNEISGCTGKTLDGTGKATCSTSTLPPGVHTITARYNGDGNYETSSGTTAQTIIACATNPVVTSIADSGANTLREAITNICSAPNNNITFNLGAGPHTITALSTLVIARNVNITNTLSATNGTVTIDAAGGNFNVFRVDSPVTSASISNLTVTGANATGVNGGGLLIQSGTVTLTGMLFTGNTVINGDGGGVAAASGTTVNVRNSTISGNTARHGGGLYTNGATLLNVTITNNNANGNTGTGACPAVGSVTGNGGGMETNFQITHVTNTIMAGNTACGLAQNVHGSFTTATNNVLSGNAQLGLLLDNGGATRTHALLSGSPALDAGDNAAASAAGLTTDQRGAGFLRQLDAGDADTTQTVDIGAFEADPAVEDIQNKTTDEDTTIGPFTFHIGDGSTAFGTITASATTDPGGVIASVTVGAGATSSERTLTIVPTANKSGTATITVTVPKTVSGTPLSMTDTFDVTVNEVNDPPSFTLPGNPAASDEDAGPQTVNAYASSISQGPNETGQTPLTFNVSVTGTTGSLAFTTAPAIDPTTGNLTYEAAANTNGTASISVTLTDTGSNTPPNSNTSAAQLFTITVNPINDPPSFSLAGNPPTVNESAGPQTVTNFATSISQGPNETGQTPLTFNLSPTGTTGTLTFSTPPAIDATTGTLTYTATNGTDGSATFDVTLSDSGSNTPPNSNTSAAQSFTITVNGVNDPPVNTVPGAITIPQDTVLTFAGATQISVTDPDAAVGSDGVITVTLTATNGTLSLSSTTGLSFSAGDGTSDTTMTFDGVIADINSALTGMQFTPTAGFTGSASVEIVSNDQGKTGTGGVQTDTDTVNITVAAPTAMYINEVAFNPDSSGENEYIELRGTPSSVIPAGTYFVAVDGDNGNLGDVTTYINLSGLSFGSNGFLVLLQNGNTYTTTAGATVVSSSGALPANAGFKGLPGGIFQADGGADSLENDSVTFMLIETGVAPSLSDDIDSDDNGTPDGSTYAGWSIRDSIGNVDGTDSNDHGYGAMNYSSTGSGSSTGNVKSVSFALTYVGRRGDTTGSAEADWVASCALGGSAPNFTLDSSPTEVEPPSFINKTLDHIGSTNFLNKTPVNTVPGAQTTDEDVSLAFNAGNANLISIDDTDANGASVKVTLTATNGTMTLSGTGGLTFTPAGAGNDGTDDAQMIFTGTLTDINAALDGLTFTPTLNYSGPASIAVDTDDLGNTGVDGAKTASATVNITVNPINDPPSFTLPGNPPAVNEDAGAQTVSGFATSISQGAGDPAQTLTFNVTSAGSTGNLAFSSGPAINATTGELTYTTSTDTNGTATFNVTLSDNGSNVSPNSNTSGVQQFTITVNAVNDAPSFQITSNPPTISEDGGAQTVNSFATNFQPGPATATDETGQTLVSYTVTANGTTGNLTFTSGPSIDNAGALTYTPTGNTSGTATFNVVATDSGSGSAPNVNQSAAVSFTITVNGINDAPVLDNTGNMSLNAINEDVPNASNNGTLVSDIILSAGGDRITDVDAGALEGIAVTAVATANGTWQFSIDNGTNWTPFGTTDTANARLLAADALTRVRFVPNLDFNGTVDPGITFHAWDQTSGTNGNTGDTTIALGGTTAFSTASETASIIVNQVNDAPTAVNDTLSDVAEDSAPRNIPFSDLLGNDLKGPANESGQSLIVKTVGNPVGGTVQILGGNVVFTPAANYSGPASFQYTVEDNGTPALQSAAAATASFNILPVADTATVTNATTNEDTQSTSGLVVSPSTNDQPSNPNGSLVTHFKITGITGGSLFQNNGTTPINNGDFITAAQGAAGLKFTPAANSNSNGSFNVQASLSGVDAGLGGGIATATITVNPVNDAPTLDAIGNLVINEDAPLQTVNLSGITAGPFETQTLTVTATSNNTGLIPNPAVTYASPNATGSLSFTPVANQSGSALITVTVNDGGGTANGGVETVVRTFTVTVNAVNDAPVNTVPGAQTTDADTPLTFSAANSNLISISDVDAAAATVQVALSATNGTLTLSSTAGLVFTVGDGTADASMTFTGTLTSINTALSGLVFTPTSGFDGAASVQITTNDLGNTGSGGALSDTDTVNITVDKRSFRFSLSAYTVGEAEGHALITVTRTGGTGSKATVDYASSDLAGLNNCNLNTGDASARCDYTAIGGTLTFMPGESSKTFTVPVINDVYVEGPETLTLTLSNVVGNAVLGTPAVATLTITDNDNTPGAFNPIDTREFLIRQFYLDTLNREPEPAGLAAWLNRLNTCPQPGETLRNCDEIEVASAFFRSPEFFDRSFFIYKFYEASLVRQPQYDEYQHDLLRMTGFLTTEELEQRKQQFMEEFVNRPEFHTLYDSFANGQPFVDAVLARAGSARQGVGAAVVVTSNRQSVINRLGAGQITRGQALRELMEAPEISQRFFNKAFVVVGYFAFLRRNPDMMYLQWINMLNTTGDYREMIRGFLQSPEFRLRFGQI